jgi:hypothetical protein
MNCYQFITEPGVGRVFPQGGFKQVCRCAPFRRETSDRHPIAGDHDGLAVLNGVEEVSEVSRRLSSSHRDHEYILSDLFRICACHGRAYGGASRNR